MRRGHRCQDTAMTCQKQMDGDKTKLKRATRPQTMLRTTLKLCSALWQQFRNLYCFPNKNDHRSNNLQGCRHFVFRLSTNHFTFNDSQHEKISLLPTRQTCVL